MFNVPILLITFNRPDKLKQQLRSICRIDPSRLYVASDGPRSTQPDDEHKIQKCRHLIEDSISDDTKVLKLYHETNLGLQKSVIKALDWFFENEEYGIILEDDIYPSQSFFYFCEEMLYKYKDDKSISLVTGFNKFGTYYGVRSDYFFSHFAGIWGWASWRRCWEKYDVEMSSLDHQCDKQWFVENLGFVLGNIRYKQLLKAKLDLEKGDSSFWAFQWALTRHELESICIVPSKSLVRNIGFGQDAMHTSEDNYIHQDCYDISFPVKSPKNKKTNFLYDLIFLKDIKWNNLFNLLSKVLKMKVGKY